MKTTRLRAALVLCIAPAVFGCDNTNADTTEESGDTSETEGSKPTCELLSTIELADANTVARNGRSGADLLAAIPESFETTLHWDFVNGDAEVEVQGAANPSTALTLTFTLPPEPIFYFDDWEVEEPTGEVIYDVEVICDDVLRTAVDITAQTEDGALVLDLPAVNVGWGPDHPETQLWVSPSVYATRSLASPMTDFVAPVAQLADSDKTFGFTFEDPQVTGSMTVYATASDERHRVVVARW